MSVCSPGDLFMGDSNFVGGTLHRTLFFMADGSTDLTTESFAYFRFPCIIVAVIEANQFEKSPWILLVSHEHVGWAWARASFRYSYQTPEVNHEPR
jgi:hypothetical protein